MAKTAKGAKTMQTTKRAMVLMSEELHRALKVYAAEHGTQVKAVVEEAVRDFLKRRKEDK
jgi:plasmid stability protein